MTTIAPPDPAVRAAGFSGELHELAGRFGARPVRLAAVLRATKGRGYHLLLLLITLPFVGPIPLPGFSIPFGVAVAVIGLRLALHQRPWLPRWILRKKLPPRFINATLRGVSRIVRALESLTRTRWDFLLNREFFQRLSGLMICLSGLLLILPLPLPFSNSLPAWTVIFLSIGTIAHDGLFFVAGCIAFTLCTAFFTLVAIGGQHLFGQILP